MAGGSERMLRNARKHMHVLRENMRRLMQAFGKAEGGNVAVIFGIASIPITIGIGAAIDYSRAGVVKVSIQDALDSALLAGAKDGGSNWNSLAADVFNGILSTKSISYTAPSFSKSGEYFYVGSVSSSVPTAVLGVVGINTVPVTANSKATAAEADNSCILTLDQGQSKTHVSLTLNGAPVINLSGCSIRSNTSLDCNGHDGNLAKSYASGSAIGCGKPSSNAMVVPDTFAPMAANITKECGTTKTGVTWTPGVIPSGAALKTVSKSGYTEYHVCGNLTLSGTGDLFGSAPGTDSVIIIENGSLQIGDNAAINAVRTAFVMTGDNNSPATIDFPTGNGKTGTFSVSPPINVGNPWQSVSVFLDPALTKTVDNKWGPGAAFNADGLVYLGNSNVVTDGNTSSANSKCTKFVMNSFRTNGSVRLDFAQQNCTAIGLKQWDGVIVHLVQ